MRDRIIGLVLLSVIVIGSGVAIQQKFVENISLQASTDEVASNSTVTIASKKFTVELARTNSEKSLGLSERASLAKGTGMLFIFETADQTSFWMKDMKFALDIVWVTDNKVIGMERNVPMPLPGATATDLPLYNSPAAIDYVLEVNAGEAATIKIGDAFSLETAKGV